MRKTGQGKEGSVGHTNKVWLLILLAFRFSFFKSLVHLSLLFFCIAGQVITLRTSTGSEAIHAFSPRRVQGD